MTPDLLKKIIEHGVKERPNEACGLLVRRGYFAEYVPCRNTPLAGTRIDQFCIDARDWVVAQDSGEILAVVHVHPGGSFDSTLDQSACDRSRVPWYTVTLDGKWLRRVPAGWALHGHPFTWGIQDCYTVLRDWHNGVLPDFARYSEFWKREDLIGNGIRSTGARVIDGSELSPGDVMLFSVHGQHADHCALFMGGGKILHQPIGRSGVVEYPGRLSEKIHSIVRVAP